LRTTLWLSPLALFLRAFGQLLIVSYVPLQLVSMGDTHYVTLGVIYGLPFLMQLLFAPVWGRLLDRNRRPGLVAAIGFLGYAAMEGGTALSGGQVGILLSLALGGIFGAALSPSAKWLALAQDDGHRTLARSLRAEAGGWLTGAVLPALLAALGRNIFLLLAITSIVTTACAFLFLRVALPGQTAAKSDAAAPSGRLRLPLPVWLLFLGLFLQFLLGEVFYAFYGVYLTHYLGGPLWLYSGSLAATTTLGLLLYGFAARMTKRSGPEPVLITTSVVYTVSYGLLALFPSVPMAAIVFSIPAFSFFRTAATIGVAEAVPERSGTAMGLLDATEGLASSVGGPVAGLFVTHFSLGVLPVLPFSLSLASSVPLLLSRRAIPERVAARQ
jgi:DHA1 family multidrug resistance protein-like MFS transporter